MIAIRPMGVLDIFQVIECNRRNLPENYQFIFLMYVVLMSPTSCFVAENSRQEIVGYAIGKPKDAMEEHEAAPSATPVGYVISIAVDQPYRRQGIGKALLATALHGLCAKLFEDGPAVTVCLNVRQSNTSAIEMYRQVFGFREETVDKEYYSNQEDALVMSRIFRAPE